MYNAKIYALACPLGGRAILVVMLVCVGLAQAGPSFISKDTTLYKYLMNFAAAQSPTATPEKSDPPPANISAPPVKSECKTNQLCYRSNPNYKYKAASRTCALPAWTEDTTFGAAIDTLMNRLPLLVLWRDLEENAGIGKDTPAGITAVPQASLQKNFQLLLLSVSATGMERLGYTVEGGIITVATIGSLPVTKSARAFNVGELLSVPSTGFAAMGFGGGGFSGNSGGGGLSGNSDGGFGGYSSGAGNGDQASYGGRGNWRAQKLMQALEPLVRPAER